VRSRRLVRSRHGQEDNIAIGLNAVGWEGIDWINVAEDKDPAWASVYTVIYLRVPQVAGNF
jgi:hypothetical protein